MTGLSARVAIVKADDFSPAAVEARTRWLIELLGGVDSLLPPRAHKVLLKPNVVLAEEWDRTAVTTNPWVVLALARLFKEAGVEVLIGEGTSGVNSGPVFAKLGWDRLAQDAGVPLLDCKGDEGVEVSLPEGRIKKSVRVPKALLECDYRVSVAKMKTHCETMVTFSLKNMKGIMSSDRERREMHFLDINETLVDLNTAFKPHLAVVEGLVAMEGVGPGPTGKPFKLGVLVGGLDAVAVDAVCAGIMGFDPYEVKHIALAAERGLGTCDLAGIEVVGARLEDVRPAGVERPPVTLDSLLPDTRVRVVKGNPCSHCSIVLASCLSTFVPQQVSADLLRNGPPVDILVGPGAVPSDDPSRIQVAVGTCLAKYRDCLAYSPGCPPWARETTRVIVEALLQGAGAKP
ncbi:MAG: DUF362 domain-containing protein [Bacillota bacterium]|nr:DUF362 domain-containing protein [Bacillota bacterium]